MNTRPEDRIIAIHEDGGLRHGRPRRRVMIGSGLPRRTSRPPSRSKMDGPRMLAHAAHRQGVALRCDCRRELVVEILPAPSRSLSMNMQTRWPSDLRVEETRDHATCRRFSKQRRAVSSKYIEREQRIEGKDDATQRRHLAERGAAPRGVASPSEAPRSRP